jgi:hypothetical protein
MDNTTSKKSKKLANKSTKSNNGGKKKVANPTGKGGFVKGKSGNPTGRPKDAPEIKLLRESQRDEMYKTFFWLQSLTKNELKMINSESLTLLQAGILKSLKIFSETGDYNHIKYPMDHIIGRAKETLDIDTGGSIQLIIAKDFIPEIGNNGNNENKSE